ncbi:uncharacterized protein V1516DRAFT_620822 [Lipomyces oligophaga]|uniref:uncharacterized protein n=1 Tax=Lipomyces oligophaga TaxID=45792 RepID=UPI0034CE8261
MSYLLNGTSLSQDPDTGLYPSQSAANPSSSSSSVAHTVRPGSSIKSILHSANHNQKHVDQDHKDSGDHAPSTQSMTSATSSTGSTEPERVPRKRRRIPLSCSVCRQRKLKCNRMQPCSACVAHDTVSLCVYAVTPWLAASQASPPAGEHPAGNSSRSRSSSSANNIPGSVLIPPPSTNGTSPEAEFIDLKARMERIESLMTKLQSTESSSGRASSSLPRTALAQQIEQLRDRVVSASSATTPAATVVRTPSAGPNTFRPEICIKKNRFSYHGPFTGAATLIQDPYMRKIVDTRDKAKMKSKHFHGNSDESRMQRKMVKKAKSPRTQMFTAEQEAFVSETLNVGADVQNIFPRLEHRPVCEYLINKFLQSINLVYPVVNPSAFRSDMMKYWEQKWKMNNLTPGKLERKCGSEWKEHMRGVALLAILLRLGRLACPANWKPSDAGFDDKYEGLFDLRLRNFAWKCLSESSYLTKANFVALQVILGIRIHNMISMEGGEGPDGTDSSSLIGLLCQVGMTMGLHRDPVHFLHVPPDLADSWRIMWAELVDADSERSLCLNVPFSLPLEYSDTSITTLCGFPSIVLQSEQPSIAFLEGKIEFALLTRKILGLILRPSFTLSREEFVAYLSDLAQFEERHLCSFQLLMEMINADLLAEVSSSQDSYDLIQKFILQLQFCALKLSLLRAYTPMTKAELEDTGLQRLQCAIKLLDVSSTCLQKPQLFAGFMSLVVPTATRFYSIGLVVVFTNTIQLILKDTSKTESYRSIPDDLAAPDLAFRYDVDNVYNLRRLLQVLDKTARWVSDYATSYYSCYRAKPKINYYYNVLCTAIRNNAVVEMWTMTDPRSFVCGTDPDRPVDQQSIQNSLSIQNKSLEVSSDPPIPAMFNIPIPATSTPASLGNNPLTPSDRESSALSSILGFPADLDFTDGELGNQTIGEWWHDWSVAVEDAIAEQFGVSANDGIAV